MKLLKSLLLGFLAAGGVVFLAALIALFPAVGMIVVFIALALFFCFLFY